MDREDQIIRKIAFTFAGLISFFFLPIVPIQVVPEVSIRAIDINRNPVGSIIIYQDWKHSTFESEAHRDEVMSGEDGFATFSKKRIWISASNFLFNTIGEYTIGLIAIHASSGPFSHFIVAKDFENKRYWGDLYFCYGTCKENALREIVIKEETK